MIDHHIYAFQDERPFFPAIAPYWRFFAAFRLVPISRLFFPATDIRSLRNLSRSDMLTFAS